MLRLPAGHESDHLDGRKPRARPAGSAEVVCLRADDSTESCHESDTFGLNQPEVLAMFPHPADCDYLTGNRNAEKKGWTLPEIWSQVVNGWAVARDFRQHGNAWPRGVTQGQNWWKPTCDSLRAGQRISVVGFQAAGTVAD